MQKNINCQRIIVVEVLCYDNYCMTIPAGAYTGFFKKSSLKLLETPLGMLPYQC